MSSSWTKIKLLIVEDHKDLAENLFEFLGEQRYELDFAQNGLVALHLLAKNNYDVIVLDLMLPAVDGYEICQRVRCDLKSRTPIIMITALGTLSDKEKGFDLGADDYLVKPFELRELQLRIDALYRRGQSNQSVLVAGELIFDPGTLRLEFNRRGVVLSGISAHLLEILARAYPNFVSHEDITENIWGVRSSDIESSALRTHIYTLRRTLNSNFGYDFIKTVHGRGYRIEMPTISDEI